jgi:hypothetical protein
MYRPIPDDDLSVFSKAKQWKILVGAGGVKPVGSLSSLFERLHKSTSGVSVASYIQTLHEWSATGQPVKASSVSSWWRTIVGSHLVIDQIGVCTSDGSNDD